MRIPFPRRFDYLHAGGAAVVLSAVLFWEGNSALLCVLVFAQIMVATFGFNLTGGFSSPAGSYVFFITLLTGTLGTIVKAILNEPLAENVPNVAQIMMVYLVGTCSMVVAVRLSQYFRPSRPFLQGGLTQENTPRVVAGCFVLAAGIPLAIQLSSSGAAAVASDAGTLASLVRQLNLAGPLGIIIAVYQRTKFTEGRTSFSWLALVMWVYLTGYGIFGYSKEGIFYPTFAWIIAAASARLRVSIPQVLATVGVLAGAMLILVPFSQYGRNFRDLGSDKAIELLSHPLDTREKALAVEEQEVGATLHWYRKPQGLFDRLTLLPIDAALVSRTDQIGTIGVRNVFIYFQNIVPHFLAPDKPFLLSGNEYAHEVGLLPDDDTTTGVSFSPFSEAYHLAGWTGLLLLMPAMQLIMLVVVQWAAGTVDQTPWSIFYVVAFAHVAAEGGLSVLVLLPASGTVALVATATVMLYLAPVIGSLIIGPEKSKAAQSSFERTF